MKLGGAIGETYRGLRIVRGRFRIRLGIHGFGGRGGILGCARCEKTSMFSDIHDVEIHRGVPLSFGCCGTRHSARPLQGPLLHARLLFLRCSPRCRVFTGCCIRRPAGSLAMHLPQAFEYCFRSQIGASSREMTALQGASCPPPLLDPAQGISGNALIVP